ncbi:hypothetical protein [Rhizobium leguminosarum]|uniref:Uncharacterized protein n=1 Tax=Rhizobium leguminosarum TaxID=384 RepID=A0A7K3VUB1_RHILE|nr:hypothetical protein [Rhizobium leguminosarum]NEK20716.1 hypothetical protein [Rhizobium leguminosarum]
MANDATTETLNTTGHAKRSNGMDLLAQIKMVENGSVEAFLADIRPILRAFAKPENKFKYKKPVNKINNECYRFLIGKLGNGVVKSQSEGVDILDKLISAALDDADTEFRKEINKAYDLDAIEEDETPAVASHPPNTGETGESGPITSIGGDEGHSIPRERSRSPIRRS